MMHQELEGQRGVVEAIREEGVQILLVGGIRRMNGETQPCRLDPMAKWHYPRPAGPVCVEGGGGPWAASVIVAGGVMRSKGTTP